jgi:uncharacterized membrane protein YccC
MESPAKVFSGITQLDKTAFSLSTGIRSAIFVILPLTIGFALGQPESVFVGLGALFLTNTEGPHSTISLWVLLVGCITEAAAWGLGTLTGTTGIFAPALVGVGVLIALLARGNPKWNQVATYTAITFAVGAGLPGGSISDALQRSSLSLLGALLALIGAELNRIITRRKARSGNWPALPSLPLNSLPRTDAILNAAVLGIASAVGFGLALALGLPRDFWVVVTIVITVRPSLSLTLTFTSMMVIGTILGAAIGAALAIEISSPVLLLALLFLFSVLMFATRGVNLGVVQIFLTPFIIILLNILYPGKWEFAEIRILDVAIGGAIAVATVYSLGLRQRIANLRKSRQS